jgi:hypothetical protein
MDRRIARRTAVCGLAWACTGLGIGILLAVGYAAMAAPPKIVAPTAGEKAPDPQKPVSRKVALPPLEPLFDFPLRDPSICIGGDGMYYLTGTTGFPTWWQTNEGIRVWKSPDLKKWEPLGLVWRIDNVYGPYGPRYLAIPHGGHNMIFKDRSGQWWSTFFGNDPRAPFRERPAILRIERDENGLIRPKP